MRHRDGDNPAVILFDGTRKWYTHGKIHRVCGPAVILGDNNACEWWIEGIKYTQNTFIEFLSWRKLAIRLFQSSD